MTKLFEEIIVHAGWGKTATSVIQSFLRSNADSLKHDNSLFYPILEDDPRPFKENHSIWVSSMFASGAHTRSANVNKGFNTPEKLAVLNAATERKLEDLFKNSGCKRLLISAEGISTLPTDSKKRFGEWLSQYSDTISGVLCLRHPLDAFASEIQQKLKLGKTLFECLSSKMEIEAKIDVVENVFLQLGATNKLVYDFFEAKEHPQGVVGKFYEVLSLKFPETPIETPLLSNRSMSFSGAALLSCLNHVRPRLEDDDLGSLRLVNDLKYYIRMPGEKFHIPAGIRSEFLNKNNTYLKQLERRFGLKLQHSQSSEHKEIISEEALSRLANISKVPPNSIELALRNQFVTISNYSNIQTAGEFHNATLCRVAERLSDHMYRSRIEWLEKESINESRDHEEQEKYAKELRTLKSENSFFDVYPEIYAQISKKGAADILISNGQLQHMSEDEILEFSSYIRRLPKKVSVNLLVMHPLDEIANLVEDRILSGETFDAAINVKRFPERNFEKIDLLAEEIKPKILTVVPDRKQFDLNDFIELDLSGVLCGSLKTPEGGPFNVGANPRPFVGLLLLSCLNKCRPMFEAGEYGKLRFRSDPVYYLSLPGEAMSFSASIRSRINMFYEAYLDQFKVAFSTTLQSHTLALRGDAFPLETMHRLANISKIPPSVIENAFNNQFIKLNQIYESDPGDRFYVPVLVDLSVRISNHMVKSRIDWLRQQMLDFPEDSGIHAAELDKLQRDLAEIEN